MAKICRTCTQNINTKDYFYLDGSSFVSSTLCIKDLLQNCVPNFDVNAFPDSTICRNCVSALHIAYLFKTEAIKNEEAFHSKMHMDEAKDPDSENFTNDNLQECKVKQEYEDCYEVKNLVDELDEKSVSLQTHEFVKLDEDLPEQDTNSSILSFGETEENFSEFHAGFSQSQDDLQQNDYPIENYTIVVKNEMEEHAETKIDSNSDTSNKSNVQKATTDTSLIKQTQGGEKPYHCTVCPYKTNHKLHLKEHLMTHTGERPFSCSECNKKFITKRKLDEHSRIHTGEKPYCCTKCNFRATHKLSVTYHIKKVHLGIPRVRTTKPSLCTICGKYLSSSACLYKHMKIHMGVKAHLCDFCGKHFHERAALKAHMSTHTREKPFKCDNCDYVAGRKAHLQDHIRTHTDEPLIECNQCGKRYTNKSFLKKHINEEHKGVPVNTEQKQAPNMLLKCSQCEMSFTNKILLRRHMKEVHKTEMNILFVIPSQVT